MANHKIKRTTSRIDPTTLANRPAAAETEDSAKEAAKAEFLRLRQLQMRVLYVVWIFSGIAIALYFANQTMLAQIGVLLATVALIALCWVSYIRYKRNRNRREEILAELDVERDGELRALFNEARNKKGLPPDEVDTTGYTATMKRERARIAEKTGVPDRVQQLQNKKGSGSNGSK